MVRGYSPVSQAEEDQTASPSMLCRCPKLTRYKLVATGLVLIVAMILLVMATVRSTSIQVDTSDLCAITSETVDVWQSGDSSGLRTGAETGDGRYRAVSSNRKLPMDGPKAHLAGIESLSSSSQGGDLDAVKRRMMKRQFPAAIIIGARKAGTRALLRFLSLHPDVVTSKREPHFFDRYYSEGLGWYKQQMPLSLENQLTIEKTPNYFVDWDVPKRVCHFNSSIKLILIVRNPIDRAMSDYLQLKEKFYMGGSHGKMGSFEEMVVDQYSGEINKSYAPIKRSLYIRHLDKWLAYFPLSQVHIVDGELIKARPWEEMYRVEEFLGLSHKVVRSKFIYNETKGFYCIKQDVLNATTRLVARKDSSDSVPWFERCLVNSKGRDHPYIDPEVRWKLREFFKPFNKRFFQRVQKTFDWP